MPLAAFRPRDWTRCWSVETVFACIVVFACACSMLIAHMSAVRPRHRHHHQPKHIEFATQSPTIIRKQDIRKLETIPQSDSTKSKLSHPHFKGYIIENPDLCGDTEIDMVIYFHSEVSHYETRVNLRESWANSKNFKSFAVKIVFFLGDAAQPEDSPGVLMEQAMYGDIVQGDFVDTFRNLSVKAIMASHWISVHCSNAMYVIKADDDVFVDLFRIVEFLVPQIVKSPTTLMCHYHKNGSREIQREPKSRWYIPETLLSGSHFPEFCSGYFVLMTSDALPALYKESKKVPLISVDDAFLFGLSARKVKRLKFVDISKNMTLQSVVQMEQYKSHTPVTLLASVIQNKQEHRTLFEKSVVRATGWLKQHASNLVVKLKETLGESSG